MLRKKEGMKDAVAHRAELTVPLTLLCSLYMGAYVTEVLVLSAKRI
jgi:hypothetical protein